MRKIEQNFENLSKNELQSFRRWFQEFDSQEWDQQIEGDAEEGKFDALADEATKEFETGKVTKF